MSEINKKEEFPSLSQRFTDNMVSHIRTSLPPNIQELNLFQRRLLQSYYISIDMALNAAEIKRLRKKDKDHVEIHWKNVNMGKLAIDIIAFAKIGLDPAQDNHINVIPFKNNNTGQYDINFMIGYRGMEIKAKKYGLDGSTPDDVIVELVYSTDKFTQIKKSQNNKVESYNFEVTDSFNRGELMGGFYYHSYYETPEKNKLEVFTLKEIEKRKPRYASAEFWGGEKDIYKAGKKVGTEKIEGWFEKMAHKTIYRAAYNVITIDSEKIDDNYQSIVEHITIDDYHDVTVPKRNSLPAPNSVDLEDGDKSGVHHPNIDNTTTPPLEPSF